MMAAQARHLADDGSVENSHRGEPPCLFVKSLTHSAPIRARSYGRDRLTTTSAVTVCTAAYGSPDTEVGPVSPSVRPMQRAPVRQPTWRYHPTCASLPRSAVCVS
jgi:hypothetical protein